MIINKRKPFFVVREREREKPGILYVKTLPPRTLMNQKSLEGVVIFLKYTTGNYLL